MTHNKYKYTEEQFDALLDERVDIARALTPLEKRKKETSTELKEAFAERGDESADMGEGVTVVVYPKSRESLNGDLLTEALLAREIDPEEVATIIREATSKSEYTELRVNIPKPKDETAKPKTRKRSTKRHAT